MKRDKVPRQRYGRLTLISRILATAEMKWSKRHSPYGDADYRRHEMEQTLVVILLKLRKTPRLSLGRFSVKVSLREPELCFKEWFQRTLQN